VKKQKLTPWFPAHVTPVRPGDYLTGDDGIYRNWDGERWSFHWTPMDTPERIERQKNHRWVHGVHITWRGLAEQPK
jgi:hypothetical protein